MGELRKHYILDRYVIIATERAKRPDQFSNEPESKKVDMCFFCPGNEHITPPEIMRLPQDQENWKIRVFLNKFAAVHDEGDYNIITHNNFYTFASAYGYHEVIVETPDHEKELADLSIKEITDLLRVYAKRIEVLSQKEGIKYVSVFKNSGKNAGTSLVHSHSQIIAYNIVPTHIVEEENAYQNSQSDIYGEIIERERNSDRRIIETQNALAFCPYASQFPMEAWIFPKRYIKNITEFNDEEYLDFAQILKNILTKLKSINAPFNYDLHYGVDKLRFHIEILPRITKWAGFEHSTGTIINVVTPEEAAKFYRD